MLTSAGRSRRISESTALGVGSMMSMSRLWVRFSKCSRLSLYLWGERITAITFFSVGSGTGPTTVAPARVTVSTILRADESMTSWSYDLSRMRIFCPAMTGSLPLVLWLHCVWLHCGRSALLLSHHYLSVKFLLSLLVIPTRVDARRMCRRASTNFPRTSSFSRRCSLSRSCGELVKLGSAPRGLATTLCVTHALRETHVVELCTAWE